MNGSLTGGASCWTPVTPQSARQATSAPILELDHPRDHLVTEGVSDCEPAAGTVVAGHGNRFIGNPHPCAPRAHGPHIAAWTRPMTSSHNRSIPPAGVSPKGVSNSTR